MVRDKNGKAPSKKIVDEVFSTPPVLAEAGKKQSKTKKTTKTRSKGVSFYSMVKDYTPWYLLSQFCNFDLIFFKAIALF